MNETTFENARVGDRVWDIGLGWGEIVEIRDSSVDDEYIVIAFAQFHPPTYYRKCNSFGFNNFGMQTLFWDEIKFEAPPRPKRMVKKVVEGCVNLQEMETGVYSFCLPVWNDKGEAERKRFKDKVYLGEPLFIHHEYEVEE